jgi:hypothetical protein
MDIGLKGCWSVCQAEWYYKVLEVPVTGFKGSLPFVPLLNTKPMIGIAEIKLREDARLRKLV